MIPDRIYIFTVDDGAGNVGAATVNRVTQTAYAPSMGNMASDLVSARLV